MPPARKILSWIPERQHRARVEQLTAYVRSLGNAFKIYMQIDGDYDHVGATIADAVLQANRDYEKIVRPRVTRILAEYPECRTTTALNQLLESTTINSFLDYDGQQRKQRFADVLCLLRSEEIETTNDLRRWLSDDTNLEKVRAIKGIGPKTVDYFKILVGLQTAAIDRRLEAFLGWAKVQYAGYNEAREIINEAADLLGCERAHFDHSIWRYVGEIWSNKRPCPAALQVGCELKAP
jgi:hypothetical protein